MLLLLLAFCCLSNAFAAKITKKVEKTSEKPEVEAAASPIEEENDDEDAGEDGDDDDDDEEEETGEPAVDAADKEAAVGASSNKNPNAVQAATDPTDLSVWGMVRTLWGWLRSDLSESLFGDDDDGKPASGSSAVGESPSRKQKIKKANTEQNAV